MIRAYVYVLIAGAIWLGEGFLFSHYLRLAAWQVGLVVALYTALYVVAVRYFWRALQTHDQAGQNLSWRAGSTAPLAVALIGSFASLPLTLAVVALGKLV